MSQIVIKENGNPLMQWAFQQWRWNNAIKWSTTKFYNCVQMPMLKH